MDLMVCWFQWNWVAITTVLKLSKYSSSECVLLNNFSTTLNGIQMSTSKMVGLNDYFIPGIRAFIQIVKLKSVFERNAELIYQSLFKKINSHFFHIIKVNRACWCYASNVINFCIIDNLNISTFKPIN